MNSSECVWAVVPAAGVGSRMLADRPKQYLEIGGRSVLSLTLSRLASHPRVAGIVLALSDGDPWWPTQSIALDCPLLLACGGAQRADSVANALNVLAAHVDGDPWVLVHDAARPCLRHADIDQMLERLCAHPVGGILGIPVNDTVKRVDDSGHIVETVNRKGLWRAATPQMFRLGMLRRALKQAKDGRCAVTDEAGAIELAGWQPMMVEGHADNIKITLPQDLTLAALYLQQQGGER